MKRAGKTPNEKFDELRGKVCRYLDASLENFANLRHGEPRCA